MLTVQWGNSGGWDVGLILQVATFLVAAIGPFLAYHYARKLAVSGNRQAWLDALRQDLAALISLADLVALIAHQVDTLKVEGAENLLRDKMAELQVIRFRIRLRLRAGDSTHAQLIAAIEALIWATEAKDEDRSKLRQPVVTLAEAILEGVSNRIEKGR